MRFCALPLAAAWQGGKRPGYLYGLERDAGHARKPAGALHLAHACGQPQALLLVERVPVEGTEKELVIINLHLEAYDDGEGKRAQTEQLMQIIVAEYRNGNYVIAGGDFNQTFEGADTFPVLDESTWQPGKLYNSELPAGFSYVFDASKPTCRVLD